MFEPPAKTCAAPPSMPAGRTRRGSPPGRGSPAPRRRSARIDHLTQLGAESCDRRCRRRTDPGLVSLPSFGAAEAFVMTCWTCSRPASDSGERELRVPLVTVLHGDLAAVLPDERQGVVPVLAGRSRCPTCRGWPPRAPRRARRTRRASSGPTGRPRRARPCCRRPTRAPE